MYVISYHLDGAQYDVVSADIRLFVCAHSVFVRQAMIIYIHPVRNKPLSDVFKTSDNGLGMMKCYSVLKTSFFLNILKAFFQLGMSF